MTLKNKLIIKILKLKLVILLEYQNIKMFLKKVTLIEKVINYMLNRKVMTAHLIVGLIKKT